MHETPQQYTERMLSYVGTDTPLDILRATPAKIDRLIAIAQAATLRRRPAADKWSIGEILAHLADVEIVVGFRIRFILGAPGSPIVGFDQDRWAVACHYDLRDPRHSLEGMRSMRQATVGLIELLEPEQWQQFGIHSERGKETIERVVRMFAGHDLNHLRQIERLVPGGDNNA
jgi:DinB superfamily